MNSEPSGKAEGWRQFLTTAPAIALAAAVYLLLAVVQGLFVPGLQYDEAIFAHGAVHMARGHDSPPFNHPHDSWLTIGRQPVQLMVMEYAGAAKSYLLLPWFAIFGGSVRVLRIASVVLGAIGIIGVGFFARWIFGGAAGLIAALLLAVHPGYIGWTAFDNTGMAIWMLGLAASLAALRWFIVSPGRLSAFALGAALGFSVWGRANFVWLIIATLLGAVAAAPVQTWRRARWTAVGAIGGVAGGAPLLLYLVQSRVGTFEFMRSMAEKGNLLAIVPQRMSLAFDAIFCDAHRRWIWGGDDVPRIQSIALLAIIALAVLVSASRRGWPRALAVAFVCVIALTFLTRMPLRPYHFAAYIPVAALLVVAAGTIVSNSRSGRVVSSLLLAAYLLTAISWNMAAGQSMRRTGGNAYWTDAMFRVSDFAVRHYSGKDINVLDWGFGNSMFVISDGSLRVHEIFWNGSPDVSTEGRSWREHAERGGVFVAWADPRIRGAAASAFADALHASGRQYDEMIFRSRTGDPAAIIYDVPSGR